MKTILCVGDSLTFGEKDVEGGGWVERLRRHYLVEESNFSHQETLVYNLGVASETTDGLVARVEFEAKRRLVGKQPCIVVLGYGLNDIKIHKNKNLVPISYFERNLLSAINTLTTLGAKILVQNIPPINSEIDGIPDQNRNLRFSKDVIAYNCLIERTVEKSKESAIYVDVFNLLKDSTLPVYANDKLHLNAVGHRLIFEQFLSLLEKS